jgi:hypothetical protein
LEPAIISSLAGLGAAGAVIIALLLTQKAKAEADKEAAILKAAADKELVDRFEKIVDRHLISEEANRRQVSEMAESNRGLFDRVITVCTSLGGAINELSTNTRANERALVELSSSTKANEKAIIDLRCEFRSLGGPPPVKAIGHEDPRPPFVSG